MKCLPIILFALLLCSWGCKNRSTSVQTENSFASDSTEININQVTEKTDEDTLAEYRDTLIGNFNGHEIDTLIAEPNVSQEDNRRIYFNWRVITKNNTVKPLEISNTIGIQFIYEGDLDGNGTDEWGYITEWPTSCWMFYNAFTNVNGEWQLLIEPTSIFIPHLDDIEKEDIVQSTGNSKFLKVKFSDVRNEGGSFLLIDTLIMIRPQPIGEI